MARPRREQKETTTRMEEKKNEEKYERSRLVENRNKNSKERKNKQNILVNMKVRGKKIKEWSRKMEEEERILIKRRKKQNIYTTGNFRSAGE